MREIAVFYNEFEAEFAAGYLRDHDVQVELVDRNVGGSLVAFGVAAGGIKLFVPDHQIPYAEELLQELQRPDNCDCSQGAQDNGGLDECASVPVECIGGLLC